jgi:Haemolymph juvenile hormone binding protein (JHBP)
LFYFSFNPFRVNADEFKIDILKTYPLLEIEGGYDLLMKILGQNLDTNGKARVSAENSREKLQIKAQQYQKADGKTYLKFDKVKVKFQAGKILDIKFSNQKYDASIVAIINAFVTSNQEFLLNNVYPVVENEFSKAFNQYLDEILGNVPVDELFA